LVINIFGKALSRTSWLERNVNPALSVNQKKDKLITKAPLLNFERFNWAGERIKTRKRNNISFVLLRFRVFVMKKVFQYKEITIKVTTSGYPEGDEKA